MLETNTSLIISGDEVEAQYNINAGTTVRVGLGLESWPNFPTPMNICSNAYFSDWDYTCRRLYSSPLALVTEL